MAHFERKVAYRYLWSRRKEAFITIITVVSVLGVALADTILCMTLSIMTGFEEVLKEKLVGVNAHITIRKFYGNISEWPPIRDEVRKEPGVVSVDPFTYNQALIQFGERATGVLVRGIEESSAAAAQVGNFLPPHQPIKDFFHPPPVPVERPDGTVDRVELPTLLVGRSLALTLGLRLGDTVTLLSPNMGSTPFGLAPRYRRFLVAGIYHSGLTDYETGLVYAPLDDAQEFFRLDGEISGVEVRVSDIDEAPAIGGRVRERLNALGEGLSVMDWTESNRALWEALKLEKKVYFLVLTLLVVLASFSIVTTLVMVVLEKRKDIAVFRTLGAPSRSVAKIFVSMGACIGVVGTTLGLLGGALGCLALRAYGFELDTEIFPVSTVPVSMNAANFALVGVSSLVICFVATLYPAWRASKLDPCEVLRYE